MEWKGGRHRSNKRIKGTESLLEDIHSVVRSCRAVVNQKKKKESWATDIVPFFPAQWPGYNICSKRFCKPPDTSKVDICSKHGVLISWLSHQEVVGAEVALFQANNAAKQRMQFVSCQCIFVRPSGDIYSHLCDVKTRQNSVWLLRLQYHRPKAKTGSSEQAD